jgi:hypothetical protein
MKRRLGFNEGGWVQPDEGATNVLGRIQQATLGQEWLADRLNVFPSSGWHLDPFGNSAISPLLFEGCVTPHTCDLVAGAYGSDGRARGVGFAGSAFNTVHLATLKHHSRVRI